MSDRSVGVEWVEATEEVVITQEAGDDASAVVPVLEAAESPIQKLLDAVGRTDSSAGGHGFYCEECLTLFQDPSDPSDLNGPSFILDFPTSLGVPQRALLTLPFGLMVGRSSVPGSGVGVINHGPVVFPGMHFGPYEGEVATREEAVASSFSWEIFKGEDEYEYVDASRETHSNWMRYVNCARNKEEANLLAVQYKGSILFHCCRTVNAGDELLLWPSSKSVARFSDAWSQMWLLKLNPAEGGLAAASHVFLCSQCQLSFTTEAFLQRHTLHLHPPGATPAAEEAAADAPAASVESVEANTCVDCGKTFKQMPHLRRHKLCVHSNKRPYCCPQCRRTFSQASGLIRHQAVHRKQSLVPHQHQSAAEDQPEPEAADVTDTEKPSAAEPEPAQHLCSNCSKSFTNEVSLKKHKMSVHERLRPYVCSMCQKCFGQFNDLTRHLRSHQRPKRRKEEPAADAADALPFGCAECSLAFPSVDSLEQHIGERHSPDAAAQSHDPDFIPQPSEAETVKSVQTLPCRRPQRLGARSKISAITKLIAPRRRADSGKAPPSGEREAPASPNAKNKWFSCNRCKRTYDNSGDLKGHACASRQHTCRQCGANFATSAFLRRHEQAAHEEAKPHSCQHCDKVFTSPGNLKQHQKSNSCTKYHCTSELFPCSYCQFSFTVKSYLVKHVKRHHPVEYVSRCEPDAGGPAPEEDEASDQYKCPHCGKSCASAKAFKSHACFQQVKVLYLCTDCGKGFTNHYGLKQHQRIHTGEKPYSCPHCPKSFSYTGQLNVHLRTHTGEKPYLCTHCGESFRQSGDLKRHEQKHTGVRPYSCPECCKSFSRPQSLKAHQMLHRGQRMFKCTQCGKSFSRNYHLKRHHQKMHS